MLVDSLWHPEILPLQWGVAICASLVAAVIDLRSRRIPNRLTGSLLALGLLWATVTGGVAGLGHAVLACVLLSFPFVLLFIFAGGGAGDAKLMGALGAWLGLANGIITLAAVCVVGVFLAVGFACAKNQMGTVFANLRLLTQSVFMVIATKGKYRDLCAAGPQVQEMQTIPYGVAIFLGVSVAAVGVFVWFA